MTNRERRLAAEGAREAARVRSADLARRTVGVQPDLFGGAPRELVIPARPMPNRWRGDLLRYIRVVSIGDAPQD